MKRLTRVLYFGLFLLFLGVGGFHACGGDDVLPMDYGPGQQDGSGQLLDSLSSG